MADLKTGDKPLIAQPSNQIVETIFYDLNKNFANNSWINPSNRYRTDCVKKIKEDVKHSQLNKPDLAEYIVASSPTHCLDGWSYLGRAIECHCRGDISNAKHLGYYAELRAAMAILASQGIGIFNNQHFIIDKSGDAQKLSTTLGTHEMAWLVLKEWANNPPAKDLLISVIRPNNIPLSQWLDFFIGSGSGYQIIAKQMFSFWGLDLENFEKDRVSRNESSYSPNRIATFQSQNFIQDLTYLCDFWDLFEYGGPLGFEKIDQYLLRLFIHDWFKMTTTNSNFYQNASLSKKFESKIDYMISKMGLQSSQNLRLKDFLFDQTFKYPLIFTESLKTDPSNSFNQHIQLLSRASLMLRMASGANANLFFKSKLSINDIQYWWGPLGIERGLWEFNTVPTQFNELWDDIEVALDSTKPCLGKTSQNLYDCHKNNGFSIAKLGECERIALWGFGL